MKDKKGVSEMVSYVLLIVISLAIASSVFIWLRVYIPPAQERESCPEETSITITNYQCDPVLGVLSLTIENNGNFDIDGFFIRASDNSNVLPFYALNVSATPPALITNGKYYFLEDFKLGDSEIIKFDYSGLVNIERLQVQPFISGKKNLLPCVNIADLTLRGC